LSAWKWNAFFLSSAPQPSLGLGLLHKIRLNFLEASQQFSFLREMLPRSLFLEYPDVFLEMCQLPCFEIF
jgi:hypothetical protein